VWLPPVPCMFHGASMPPSFCSWRQGGRCGSMTPPETLPETARVTQSRRVRCLRRTAREWCGEAPVAPAPALLSAPSALGWPDGEGFWNPPRPAEVGRSGPAISQSLLCVPRPRPAPAISTKAGHWGISTPGSRDTPPWGQLCRRRWECPLAAPQLKRRLCTPVPDFLIAVEAATALWLWLLPASRILHPASRIPLTATLCTLCSAASPDIPSLSPSTINRASSGGSAATPAANCPE
jgi:hypothetical protein